MRKTFSCFLFVAALASAQPISVSIDATRAGQPISKLIMGGFMEPATTQAWAEMLYDRKFLNDVNSQPEPEQPQRVMRGRRNPWRPVGPDSAIVMDKSKVWVGEHSPMVKLNGSTRLGIQQAGVALQRGKAYTGRVILAGDPGAAVEVSLVWGEGASGRQTIPIRSLTAGYTRFPLSFTAGADTTDGRLEITGAGTGTFHLGAVSLMPADNVQGYRAGVLKYLKEAGVTLTRWPGGNFVSAYDWREGIGDPDKRAPRFDPVWGALESNDVGIDEYIAMCRLIGAEPYICVNAGFGEAQGAAEEVQYVNGSADTPMGKWRAANGHPQPYKVKLWGVGNEMYGPWQYGYMSLNQFWVKHNYFVKAMREVDPTIKFVASSAMIEEMSWCAIDQEQFSTSEWRGRLTKRLPFEYGSHEDWTGGLLAHAADNIDYLGEHFYAYPDLSFNADMQRFVDSKDPLELAVRRLPNKVAYKFEAWEEYLRRMPALKGKNIKFALDEWSARYRSVDLTARATPPAANMKTPLSNALTLHEMYRHSDMVDLGAYTGGMRMAVIDAGGEAVGLRPEGLVWKVFSQHLVGRLPVTVDGNSPQRQFAGTPGVDTSNRPSGSPTYPLDVFAAVSADRKTIAISVVNPTESAKEFEWKLAGGTLGTGKLFQMAAPSVNATNLPGQKPAVEIVESTVGQFPARVSVPPISVSVYELQLR